MRVAWDLLSDVLVCRFHSNNPFVWTALILAVGSVHWKQREKNFDEKCAFANKVTHQIGLLIVIWVGLLVAIISTTAVSLLGVVELWRRLTQ